jgi:undecaprenyl-diphosphatase
MRLLYSLHSVDLRLLLLLQQSESWLAQNSRRLSRTADGHLYVILGLLLVASPYGGNVVLQHLLLAFLVERLLYWTLKNSLRRKRPYDALPDFKSRLVASDEFSFPSGHTSGAFLFVTVLVLYVGAAALPLYVWASAIAASRVFLGVHFPSDTIAGALMGSGVALSTAAWLS